MGNYEENLDKMIATSKWRSRTFNLHTNIATWWSNQCSRSPEETPGYLRMVSTL